MKLTLVTVGVFIGLLVILTVYFAVRGLKEKPISGREGLVGEIGEARTDLDPEGRVLVNGEWWNARANEKIPEGTKVKVVRAEKMLLRVVRVPDEP